MPTSIDIQRVQEKDGLRDGGGGEAPHPSAPKARNNAVAAQPWRLPLSVGRRGRVSSLMPPCAPPPHTHLRPHPPTLTWSGMRADRGGADAAEGPRPKKAGQGAGPRGRGSIGLCFGGGAAAAVPEEQGSLAPLMIDLHRSPGAAAMGRPNINDTITRYNL